MDFETRLTYKRNAAAQLERELANPNYQCSSITLGANTDPYQPVEKEYRITRQVLEVLQRHRHPVTVLFAPLIPALNDSEMETILEQSQNAGACGAAYMLLRLPLEIRELFFEWLRQHYPLRVEHVISLLRQSRGGADSGQFNLL